MTNPFDHDAVPWNDPLEWVVWLVVLVIATFFIHNSIRLYRERNQ